MIRRLFDPKPADEYLAEGRTVGFCPLLQEGDIFRYEGGVEMPEGFCPWAWIDIYRGISALSAGAETPWYHSDEQEIFCCTDGVRPVIFLLERIRK